MSAGLDPLLQPYALKHLRLRNRVVSTSHEPAFSEDGMPKDRYRLYHLEKAKGGVGLTMIGGSAVVSPDSPPSFGNLTAYKDEIVPWLRRLADDVHEAGAAVMIQLTHLGWRTSNYAGDMLPVVSASGLREPAHRSFSKQAEEWDLDRIAQDYAEAAVRCKHAGLDGVEFQHYGHLLDNFVSPLTNKRDDRFGGSLENRTAFARMVISRVREAVGPDFVLGVRMSMDERRAEGLSYDDALMAAQHYVADGIDFLSTIVGTIETDQALAEVIPSMGTPSAPFLEFTGKVRRDLGIPVMHASRVQDVATARYAVREGLVDLIGMTRAQIADPHLVNKMAEGMEGRIRPCVGANYCLDAIYQAGDTKCIHNAATGREQTIGHVLHPSRRPRRAVVVGAGPGGLEAARVLGERGHHVVVFEAGTQPGGQILLASASPRRRDLIGIVDWRVAEAQHHGVDIRLDHYADEADVLAEDPDVVVIATGGMPSAEFLAEGQGLVHDSWDVMSGSFRPTGDVLVFDDNGGHAGMDAVEMLARRGAHVQLVVPDRQLAPDVGSMNSPAYLQAFAEFDVDVTLTYRLRSVRKAADGRLVVTLWNEYADRTVERTVDHVVVENGTTPVADLYFELVPQSRNLGEVNHRQLLAMEPQSVVRNEDGRFAVYRIGDAVSSRNIHTAIYDAIRLCQPI